MIIVLTKWPNDEHLASRIKAQFYNHTIVRIFILARMLAVLNITQNFSHSVLTKVANILRLKTKD